MSLRRCEGVMKSDELMRMRDIKVAYENSRIRKNATLSLLQDIQKKYTQLMNEAEFNVSEILGYIAYIQYYSQEYSAVQLKVDLIEATLELFKATRTPKEYNMFYECCFEGKFQFDVANRYHYGTTKASEIIREVARSFLKYWDECQNYMREAKKLV